MCAALDGNEDASYTPSTSRLRTRYGLCFLSSGSMLMRCGRTFGYPSLVHS